MARITFKQAVLLAARLDLDLDHCEVCLACLSFVSLPLGAGDEHGARSGARQMSRYIWDEGLEQPALLALRRARDDRIPDAEDGLADADESGGRSLMAQGIVWHLGGDLAARARGDLLKMGFKPWPPPEPARSPREGG